jgi:beta-lactam-binding protein with PASTA domain
VPDHGLPSKAEALIGAGEAIADALAPTYRPTKHVVVPDFIGRLASDRFEIAAAAGVKTEVHRLTEPPAPVPGVVVAQAPPPGRRVRRDSVVVLDVEHQARH